MLHPARLLTLTIAFVAALVLRGAIGDALDQSDEDPGGTPTRISANEEYNTPAVQQLTQRWLQIPDVEDAHAGYTPRGSGGVVEAYAVCRSCNLTELADELAQDVWTADLHGVSRFQVRVAREDGISDPLTQEWDPVRDAAKLYDKFGNGLVDPDKVPPSGS